MRNEFQKHKKSDKIKWIVTFIVGLALIAGVAALSVKLYRKTPTVINGESYSIGMIDETGVYQSGDMSIFLRKSITANGLKCELVKNAKIKYKIFFYDKAGNFLSATEELTENFDGKNIPESAENVKIMITPTEDADGKVSVNEVLGYANQLTVTVKK